MEQKQLSWQQNGSFGLWHNSEKNEVQCEIAKWCKDRKHVQRLHLLLFGGLGHPDKRVPLRHGVIRYDPQFVTRKCHYELRGFCHIMMNMTK